MNHQIAQTHYRSVFISDVHLGTRGCQAELLLDFIRHMTCDRLYLVGDILDGWKLKGGWWWPQAHNDVVQKILRLARKGVDGHLHPRQPRRGGARLLRRPFRRRGGGRDAIHTTADGRRFLVTHGDEFDGVVQSRRWLAFAGRLGLSHRADAEHGAQRRAAAARLRLLELLGLPEGQGEERPAVHRELRDRRWPTRRAGAASTA